MATLEEAFHQYRDEDNHELQLITSRLNALLTSQSFLLAAAAGVFFGFKSDPSMQNLLLVSVIAALALLIAASAAMAITIGCSVLRAWHRKGTALIAEDEEKEDEKQVLKGLHLHRKRPDLNHILSVDVCFQLPPYVFSGLWIAVILWLWWRT